MLVTFEEELIVQIFYSKLARNGKVSKSKNAVILSKMIFFSSKKEVHIFNMPGTFVQSFRSIVKNCGKN